MTKRARRLRSFALIAVVAGSTAVACTPDSPTPAPGPSTTEISVTTAPNG